MGTTVRLYFTHGIVDLDRRLSTLLDALEQTWSRFIDDSEISRLNASAGTAMRVGPSTLLLVQRAIQASSLTRGWFDPTLLVALHTAGYDRPFTQLPSSGLGPLVINVDRRADPAVSVRVHDWNAVASRVVIDHAASTVTVPTDVAFDPGGIGKGLAADLLAQAAIDGGAGAVLIDLGGDISVAGRPPAGGWPIDIEHPFDRSRSIASARLPWGAIATSSRSRRRWLGADGIERHHLIDPHTHEPTASDVAAATVIAGECWLAESVAKAAVLAGLEVGLDLVGSLGLHALLVDGDGTAHTTPGMDGFLS